MCHGQQGARGTVLRMSWQMMGQVMPLGQKWAVIAKRGGQIVVRVLERADMVKMGGVVLLVRKDAERDATS